MAPPSNTEDQFKFLIACIKHSTAGKIDFTQVATECDIISKGAAAKRYERLMKAHGITGNGLGGGRAGSPAASGPSTPVTPGGRKAATNPRTPASKKRKLAARGADIDEDVKTEVKAEVKHEVKHEIGDAIDANAFRRLSRSPATGCITKTQPSLRQGRIPVLGAGAAAEPQLSLRNNPCQYGVQVRRNAL
ncbi:hypothetical protein M406DRAFT_329810 [Cryphonectria parasitica EP155]|uniref:Myb-like DNA-binding domain-containing protein n=1 Tax=Cryphonectria parasitica (strain ATCC 38755 / EP155) TaxID=660469 RepID=A0A9P5CQ80_CRYP1|nr:uncharacterized protein M406DRAFT_329810 [Cryphonectria parasitica EP155]KAF3765966.1 hypothetical protein M406DRAFT_329810 [Cryphonectria parasitica EP155]